ncbi:MAG TPA: hypothetical protein VK671_09970 [Mucilaginibacter sp.]|jgi:hypothetical protein|nr:hypothetical protein [Mucilaginibacter sp.]
MKNPTHEERNTRTFALLIIIVLIMTILMRGVNTRFDVPHVLYIAIAVICGLVAIISYIGFIYSKMFKNTSSQVFMDMIKIIVLGVMVYFIVTFCFGVITEL